MPSKTVTVADKQLLVLAGDQSTLMMTTGETRQFFVHDGEKITVNETGDDAFPASSSWILRGVSAE